MQWDEAGVLYVLSWIARGAIVALGTILLLESLWRWWRGRGE